MNIERGSFGPLEMASSETRVSIGTNPSPELPPPTGREKLLAFWKRAEELGITKVLNERKQRVIIAFLGPDIPSLNDLRATSGITTGEGVRQLIIRSVKRVFKALPDEEKPNYDLEELTHQEFKYSKDRLSRALKRKWQDPVYRKRMDEIRKGHLPPMKGKHHSPETRAKMRKVSKERWKDPDYKKKMSKIRKGRPSPLKGRQRSPETRARISEAHRGKHHSPETRDKMSEAHKGKKYSPETKAKMSEELKKRWQDQKYRDLMKEAHKGLPPPMKGKHHSPETRAKMKEAQRRRRQREKENLKANNTRQD